jgi:hypothetical protein
MGPQKGETVFTHVYIGKIFLKSQEPLGQES